LRRLERDLLKGPEALGYLPPAEFERGLTQKQNEDAAARRLSL
jgi:hypothetical protein